VMPEEDVIALVVKRDGSLADELGLVVEQRCQHSGKKGIEITEVQIVFIILIK